jgi:hypothetical protein
MPLTCGRFQCHGKPRGRSSPLDAEFTKEIRAWVLGSAAEPSIKRATELANSWLRLAAELENGSRPDSTDEYEPIRASRPKGAEAQAKTNAAIITAAPA